MDVDKVIKINMNLVDISEKNEVLNLNTDVECIQEHSKEITILLGLWLCANN